MRSLSKIDRESKLVVGLIPARWHSTRFEGKPLALINGVPMIRRVYDQACASKKLDTVVVLTDSQKVNDYCAKHEMRCIVIDDDVRSGTDRCAKAIELIDGDVFVNIQGDEPLINPDAIDTLVEQFDKSIGIGNAYVYVNDNYKLHDSNVVKVVTDLSNNAVYYSRFGIPFHKKEEVPFKQQLGLYAFNRHMLELFVELEVGELEKAESVEMLRYIENGFAVKMIEVEDHGLSVDTQDDLKRVEEFLNAVH